MATTQETDPSILQEIVEPKKRRRNRSQGIYSKVLITRIISLNIIYIGSNIKQTLEKIISSSIEGKCVVEGFVKPNSVHILTYSSGIIQAEYIVFDVAFECEICSPVEGMHIDCVVKNITKAGVRAETSEVPTPIIIFIARDHHYKSSYFSDIKPEQNIKVKVIGQRFELNDKYISIIAELLEPKEEKIKKKRRAKIIIDE